MFVNLTPHAINFGDRSIEPSGKIARCSEVSSEAGEHAGIKLIRRSYGKIVDLPEPKEGTIFIVSILVRQACPSRTDIASPGDLIRDNDGKIVGAINLVIN